MAMTERTANEEKAALLDKDLQRDMALQMELAAETAKLIMKWAEEVEPITLVLRKHKIHFMNSKAVGYKTSHGIIIGIGGGRPLVLRQSRVYPVKYEAEGPCQQESIDLQQFFLSADMEIVTAGFDYVRKFEVTDGDIAKRNIELSDFLKKYKPLG